MIVMNNSSLSRFVMRTPLLALLLPLCLTACLETTSQDAPTNSVNELKEVPHKEVPQQTSSENKHKNPTDASQPIKTALKAVSLNDIKTAKSELNTLIANTQCDTTAQCKVMPVGSKACGGPSDYVVYSTKSAKEGQVSSLAKQITTLEKAYNTQNEMMSTCQHLTSPSTQCVENKCVKLEGSAVSVF